MKNTTSLPTPRLSSVKAANHYASRSRVKFSMGGSNLALKAQAFFLSQPSFRSEHQIELPA